MKKMPRKFSEGGTAPAPVQTKPTEAKKKPADNMPDWAKKAREEQKADMATDKGYKAATAKDSLAPKGFKKGGSIKKFAEGDSVTLPSNETYRFNPDTYEKARRYVETGKKDDEQEKPKAKSSAAPKAAPKEVPKKSEPAAAPKSEETTSPTSRSVNQRIKDALTPKESRSVKDNESDSDLSVEPRRYLPRGRNYSATGDMSPEAEKAVDRASLLAGVAGLGRAALTRGARGLNTLMRSEGNLLTGPEARRQLTGPEARSLVSRSETPALPAPAASRMRNIFKRDAEDAVVKSEKEAPKRRPNTREESDWEGEGGRAYKRGGKVAKYAKGGGVESKGKTKGTVVKMAKGGSVKGWGIARGSKACKMV